MKYAHLADLHLGSWRDEEMRKLSTATFEKAINSCINQKVDFILFAGDIFNNALPAIDIVNFLAFTLQKLKKLDIPLYVIPGSHDFSPTNRSMIDVLESAGLLTNVCKGSINKETKLLELNYTTDPKTKAKITGILGRRGMLGSTYYENLNREKLESEPGYKIFMFHTTLTELKPKHLEMLDSCPASFLPKNQDYYAGGHIHHRTIVEIPGFGPMTYTGALFPNNFSELKKYSNGGFYIIETSNQDLNKTEITSSEQKKSTQIITYHPIKIKDHIHLEISAKSKTPETLQEEIIDYFQTKNKQTPIIDKIITISVNGKLEKGKASDIKWGDIFKTLGTLGAYHVLKNDLKIQTQEYQEFLQAGDTTDSKLIEESLIKEHLGQFKTFNKQTELDLIKNLLSSLNTSKKEAEKTSDFQKRIKQDINVLLANNNH
ncbi:exonuclease SbcCD subunit D [archaeon]|jgi:DNA repair protein SbcD/Mre11|nr:exonuclease SbcCD subunit D [archaeon]MBT6697455.1 exonuclease SbcCD subunit D [archaeon]